ncbi:integrase, catalytic region, zinc finger, CCHC-type containing protein [Tanacetum coccineum]
MSTQQDIYAASFQNPPHMLNKDNYAPWSSRLLCYAKSKPNRKMLVDSILHGLYVRRMIVEPGDPDCDIPIAESFHEQTDEDIYAAVDSFQAAQETWLRVQQMMKGYDIREQEKNTKFFNGWELFRSTEGESIESYYHRFIKLMNNFAKNKHIPEKIASNLKFLNNLQPKWKHHVTIVYQMKDFHTIDYTHLYDFLKFNQAEVNEIRAEWLAKTHDPLALMANSQNPYNYPVFHPDHPSQITYMQHPPPNNKFNARNQNRYNAVQNARNQVVQNAVQNPCIMNVGNQNGLIAVPGIANQNGNGNVVAAWAEGNGNGNNDNQIRCYNCRGLGHYARNCTVRPRRRDVAYLQTQLLIAQKEEARIQLQVEEFDLMAAAGNIDEIEEVNANCILMANLQQESTSSTQTEKASVYDSDGLAKVHHFENCYDNEILNMFTQEEQYTELLEPITEPHPVQQHTSNVIFVEPSVEHLRNSRTTSCYR